MASMMTPTVSCSWVYWYSSVSYTHLVLQRLQENGLVKIVPYKGTTVTRLNRDIVDELIYERIAVEAKVLRDFRPSRK